jgi:hypothetical protein
MEEIIGFWKRKVKMLIITTIPDKCNSHKLDYKSYSSTNNSCVPTVILAKKKKKKKKKEEEK